ncbi:hypothetical protein ACJX0J_040445, partial [Zea mays]
MHQIVLKLVLKGIFLDFFVCLTNNYNFIFLSNIVNSTRIYQINEIEVEYQSYYGPALMHSVILVNMREEIYITIMHIHNPIDESIYIQPYFEQYNDNPAVCLLDELN